MIKPAAGPFLFDTSAESWLARAEQPELIEWMRGYLLHHEIHVSAVTVMERGSRIPSPVAPGYRQPKGAH